MKDLGSITYVPTMTQTKCFLDQSQKWHHLSELAQYVYILNV